MSCLTLVVVSDRDRGMESLNAKLRAYAASFQNVSSASTAPRGVAAVEFREPVFGKRTKERRDNGFALLGGEFVEGSTIGS